MSIREKIESLLSQVAELQATNAEQVEALRIKYLSKKGQVTELFNEFREVPKEEKREIGQALNQLRQAYETRINELREAAEANGAKAAITAFDWLGLIMISFILPAVICPLIGIVCRKLGWIKEGDLKLD